MKKPSTPQLGGDDLSRYSIAPKLQALRAERAFTLSRLAAGTGLSTALLSKLERDRMVPTLATLAKIANVFGVDLAYFFSSVTHHSASITRNVDIADPRRVALVSSQKPLHYVRSKRRQATKIVDIPEGLTLNLSDGHDRIELTAYVLEGVLHMTAVGLDETLHSGDCLVLDTDAVILWSAPQSRCRVLTVAAQDAPGTDDRYNLPR